MIRAGGAGETNHPVKGLIQAGGHKVGALPIRTALATGFSQGQFSMTAGPFDLLVGETLLVATCVDNGGGDPSDVTIDIGLTGMIRDVMATNVPGAMTVCIFRFKADYTRLGANVTANFFSVAFGAMLVSKVSGISGVLKASKLVDFGATTSPDSGLATISYNLPQFHWGIIGTTGAGNDTVGAWQAAMAEGQHEGAYATIPKAYVKEGYRSLITPVQARAAVTGQTLNVSSALVACYA